MNVGVSEEEMQKLNHIFSAKISGPHGDAYRLKYGSVSSRQHVDSRVCCADWNDRDDDDAVCDDETIEYVGALLAVFEPYPARVEYLLQNSGLHEPWNVGRWIRGRRTTVPSVREQNQQRKIDSRSSTDSRAKDLDSLAAHFEALVEGMIHRKRFVYHLR